MTIYTILEYDSSPNVRRIWVKLPSGVWTQYAQSAADYWASVSNGGVLGNYEVRTVAQANNIDGIPLVFNDSHEPIHRWQRVDTEPLGKTIQIGLTVLPINVSDPDKTIQIGLEGAPEPSDPDKTIQIGLEVAPSGVKTIQIGLDTEPVPPTTRTIEIGMTTNPTPVNNTIVMGLRNAPIPPEGTEPEVPILSWLDWFFNHRWGRTWYNKYYGRWSNRY